ncbi:MAG TPA: DUF542 domain-containing protein [Chloroflexota bacterium]|nr:DUF542 domain-containing protein [Chloroflexota bacterium]
MDTTRTSLTADWTVNEVVAAYPSTLRVLGRYGIDACCGGPKSLRAVAAAHNFSLDQLLADLGSVIAPEETILDVRPDLAAGHDPLGKIIAAAEGTAEGRRLVIVVRFEPVPLYSVLAERGFAHQSERTSNGDWRVTFSRGA